MWFRRMIDKVTSGPFGSAGETSEETWPGEDCKKCETREKEDGCVENEASVVEKTGLNPVGFRISRAWRVRIVRLVITTRRHHDLARPGH